ncbi:MAG: DUF1569 domain-containing protein [Chitinophagaceae bacterium]|nr:DUF1569 domain-containing protein [Chitinophagaceae bacterium]
MDAIKANFIRHEFIQMMKSADSNTTPRWGKMNFQQMAEHVTAFFKVSSGKIILPFVSPEEHLPKLKAFLQSDKEFRENTKAPEQIIGEEPLPLRNATVEQAIEKLQQSIEEFFNFFADDPLKTATHPVFGALNFEEWILLHYKHVLHHSKQFGLVK